MTAVFFDTNALYIEGYRDAFTAGTLTFDLVGNMVGVRVLHGTENLVEDDWSAYTRQDGTSFATVDDLTAYLTAEFGKRRAIGEVYGTAVVAGEDLPLGMPLAVSRATGQVMLARADTYTLAFVTGLAIEAVTAGFATLPARGSVLLDDWTEQTGEAELHPGVPYFLAPEGGLTVSPFGVAGTCSVRVGVATSPKTLGVAPTDPILF